MKSDKRNLWKIYQQLIAGIDDGILVEDVVSGLHWTAVITDAGGVGLAMTTASFGIERSPIDFIGKSLKKVANLVTSWNFYDASIGMAAINAYYNTPKRLLKHGFLQPNSDFCTFGLDLCNKTVSMIGHLHHESDLFHQVKALHIIEYHPQKGDYPNSASEYLLPQSDVVIITGSSFVNKTLPRLLELSKDAFTVICGPTTPMCYEILEAFHIDRLTGFIPIRVDDIFRQIKTGRIGSLYHQSLGERFYIDLAEHLSK